MIGCVAAFLIGVASGLMGAFVAWAVVAARLGSNTDALRLDRIEGDNDH